MLKLLATLLGRPLYLKSATFNITLSLQADQLVYIQWLIQNYVKKVENKGPLYEADTIPNKVATPDNKQVNI